MGRKPRVQKGRDFRGTYYVFCEGRTEKAYIEYLRQNFRSAPHLLPIVCKSNISEKEIKSNLSQREVLSTDRIFVMYDLDVSGMQERISSIRNATYLLSNPCFELWYLLHFMNHTRHISSSECNDLLKQHVKGYKKGTIQMELSSVLMSEIDVAIDRARKLEAPGNPSTTVWQLLEALKSSMLG